MHRLLVCRPNRGDTIVVSMALLLCAASSAAAVEVSSDAFSFRLPDAFVDFEAGRADGKTTHAFIDGTRGDTDPDIVVLVEQLPGMLTRDAFDRVVIPVSVDATVFTVSWKEHALKCFEIRQEIGSLSAVTRNVQVPLAPNAIQIKVVADEARSEEAKRVLKGVLTSLEGEVGWSMSEDSILVVVGAAMFVLVVGAGIFAGVIQSRRNAAYAGDTADKE